MTGDTGLTHILDAARWCPEHHMPDCSPLLNGCNKVNRQMSQVERVEAVIQAARALAVYEDSAMQRLDKMPDDYEGTIWVPAKDVLRLAAAVAALGDGQ